MKLLITISIVLLSLTGFTQSKWTYIYGSNDRAWFYHPDRMTKEGDIITAWIRIEIAEKHLEAERKKMNADDGPKSTKYSKFNHTLFKSEYDCKSKRYRVVSLHHYGVDGGVITSNDFEYNTWKDAVPESIVELQLNTVCAASKE